MNTYTFDIEKQFPLACDITRRMGMVMNLFGMTLRRLEHLKTIHALNLQLKPGQICYITGASGTGKSVLLRQMCDLVPTYNRIRLEDIALETDRSLIDSIPGPLIDVVKLLSKVGLPEVIPMLLPPALLSSGQQFRYRLGRAILMSYPIVFADEFMASIETITAMSICRQLHVLARQTKQIFIFAGVHDTFIPDLQPDVVVIKSIFNKTRIIRHNYHNKSEVRSPKSKTKSKS